MIWESAFSSKTAAGGYSFFKRLPSCVSCKNYVCSEFRNAAEFSKYINQNMSIPPEPTEDVFVNI